MTEQPESSSGGESAAPRPISANELRALAEWADVFRGENACIVEGSGAMPFEVVKAGDVGTRKKIMDLRTDHAPPPFVPRNRQLVLDSDPIVMLSKQPDLGINDCDAIFTSMVALEKFVLPYYARLRSMKEVDALRTGFAQDANALALAHLPESVEDSLVASTKMVVFVPKQRGDAVALEALPVDEFVQRFL